MGDINSRYSIVENPVANHLKVDTSSSSSSISSSGGLHHSAAGGKSNVYSEVNDSGVTSANFHKQENNRFGLSAHVVPDVDLKTNLQADVITKKNRPQAILPDSVNLKHKVSVLPVGNGGAKSENSVVSVEVKVFSHVQIDIQSRIKDVNAAITQIKSNLENAKNKEQKISALKSAKEEMSIQFTTLRKLQGEVRTLSNSLNGSEELDEDAIARLENLYSKEVEVLTKQVESVAKVLSYLTVEKRTLQAADILHAPNPEVALLQSYQQGALGGADKAVSSYIKLKGQGDISVQGISTENANKRLPDMQKVFDSLMHDHANTQVEMTLHAPPSDRSLHYISVTTSDGSKFNFTPEELRNTDLSKLNITPDQLAKYANNFFATPHGSHCMRSLASVQQNYFNNHHKPMEGEPAYIQALHLYSTSAYRCINYTMRGVPYLEKDKNDPVPITMAAAFKEGLLHGPVVMKAISSLPPAEATQSKFLFRGEERPSTAGGQQSQDKFLETYKKAVDSGEGFILSQGVLSAASNRAPDHFNDSTGAMRAFVLVKQSAEAKKLVEYSAFPQEGELAHAERQLHISHYLECKNQNGENFTYFIAAPVSRDNGSVEAILQKPRADATMESAVKSAKLWAQQNTSNAPFIYPRSQRLAPLSDVNAIQASLTEKSKPAPPLLPPRNMG